MIFHIATCSFTRGYIYSSMGLLRKFQQLPTWGKTGCRIACVTTTKREDSLRNLIVDDNQYLCMFQNHVIPMVSADAAQGGARQGIGVCHKSTTTTNNNNNNNKRKKKVENRKKNKNNKSQKHRQEQTRQQTQHWKLCSQ